MDAYAIHRMIDTAENERITFFGTQGQTSPGRPFGRFLTTSVADPRLIKFAAAGSSHHSPWSSPASEIVEPSHWSRRDLEREAGGGTTGTVAHQMARAPAGRQDVAQDVLKIWNAEDEPAAAFLPGLPNVAMAVGIPHDSRAPPGRK